MAKASGQLSRGPKGQRMSGAPLDPATTCLCPINDRPANYCRLTTTEACAQRRMPTPICPPAASPRARVAAFSQSNGLYQNSVFRRPVQPDGSKGPLAWPVVTTVSRVGGANATTFLKRPLHTRQASGRHRGRRKRQNVYLAVPREADTDAAVLSLCFRFVPVFTCSPSTLAGISDFPLPHLCIVVAISRPAGQMHLPTRPSWRMTAHSNRLRLVQRPFQTSSQSRLGSHPTNPRMVALVVDPTNRCL
ncbi:unnamed protein product [Protopolystoma xenopodis]|uniref:Uncharacterized protein n=1 Tax=Protopolystoma xenopodis TaxID=117903 RepID=A0A3S5CRK6_9PLAT|nr:unnamed protein product [Protopolystoma xenopodis]